MTLRHRPHRVLYVPLDDRPCNLRAPRLLAQMVDYDLVTPPVEMLGSWRQPGRPEEIGQWLMAHLDPQPDCIILSLDMLSYGGLLGSRAANTRTQLAQQRLCVLADLRRQAPDAAIYGLGTILRLGTVTAPDEAALHLADLARHSVLTGMVRARRDKEDEEKLRSLERRIPPAVLGEYLAVRSRNFEINLRGVQELAAGHLDFLVLGQDVAAEEGVHRQEQAALQEAAQRAGAAERLMIVPGADELGMCLFTRFVHTHMGKTPDVRLVGTDEGGFDAVPPGEDRPFSESLRAHLRLVAAREAPPEDDEPDMVLVLNPPAPYARKDLRNLRVLRAHRKRARRLVAEGIRAAHGRGLAACDAAFPNGADDIFVQELVSATPSLPGLLAYAGWDTASNCIGCALAHGALRLISLQDKGAFDLARLVGDLSPMRYLELLDSLIASEKAHVRFLVTRLAEDWLYQARLRPLLEDHICEGLRSGIFDLSRSYGQAERLVRDELTHSLSDLWIDQFLGRHCVVLGSDFPSDERIALVLAELEETRVSLPWRRLFEIDLELEFGVQLEVAG